MTFTYCHPIPLQENALQVCDSMILQEQPHDAFDAQRICRELVNKGWNGNYLISNEGRVIAYFLIQNEEEHDRILHDYYACREEQILDGTAFNRKSK